MTCLNPEGHEGFEVGQSRPLKDKSGEDRRCSRCGTTYTETLETYNGYNTDWGYRWRSKKHDTDDCLSIRLDAAEKRIRELETRVFGD